jgi:hypothetical protein
MKTKLHELTFKEIEEMRKTSRLSWGSKPLPSSKRMKIYQELMEEIAQKVLPKYDLSSVKRTSADAEILEFAFRGACVLRGVVCRREKGKIRKLPTPTMQGPTSG